MIIDKNVPIPDNTKHKLSLLEISDSFSFPNDEKGSVRALASLYKRRHPGWNYKTKWQSDGVYRLWRIA